jgi:hypothetical protein
MGRPLFVDVIAALNRHEVPHAVAGASAMATDSVSRSTNAIDIFTTDERVLDADLLAGIEAEIRIDRRPHEPEAALVGSVHLHRQGDRDVDIVVGGPSAWHAAAVERADGYEIEGVRVPAIRTADLILLKLHTGGAQAKPDIEMLLDASDLNVLSEVDARAPALPRAARTLWRQIHKAHLASGRARG